MANEYTVTRPKDHPGPAVLRLLLKGVFYRMERGGQALVRLRPDEDAKAFRDLEAAGYTVKEGWAKAAVARAEDAENPLTVAAPGATTTDEEETPASARARGRKAKE